MRSPVCSPYPTFRRNEDAPLFLPEWVVTTPEPGDKFAHILGRMLDSGQHKSEIQTDMNEAAAMQITGTPTFVLAKTARDKLNGVRIVGALPVTTFQSAIDNLPKDDLVRP